MPLIFLRSVLFAPVFYSSTPPWVLAALAAAPFSPRLLRRIASSWCLFHRLCARILLGQKVRVIGTMPDEPVLYAFKHESMFETLDLPCFFRHPMIAAKVELLQIPLWGWVARRYGMMEMWRGAGAAALLLKRPEANHTDTGSRRVGLLP